MIRKPRTFADKWIKPILHEGQLTKWQWMVQGVNFFEMGNHVDIGAFTYINASAGVILEAEVQIGSHCSLYSVSTIDSTRGKVIVKQGARIGSHSTIMPGVTIGKNAVIGAHSFVKINVPDSHLAYGVPAKIIKKIK